MENKKVISIAIDGPAGSGKSTISKLLAKKLGWKCLETGAIYRAFTVSFLNANGDKFTDKEFKKWLEETNVEVSYDGACQNTYINGQDVTRFLRKKQVEENVAKIAQIPEIRAKVRNLQRKIALNHNVVIEGRDIGTVVIPETINKYYLDVSPEVSAKRRCEQMKSEGLSFNEKEVYAELVERNKLDKTRKISPLMVAKDAKVINTDNKNINQVVCAIAYSLQGVKELSEERAM